MPTDKVTAATVGAALSILVVWILGELSITVPAEAGAALATLLAGGLGWLIPEGSGKRAERKGRSRAK